MNKKVEFLTKRLETLNQALNNYKEETRKKRREMEEEIQVAEEELTLTIISEKDWTVGPPPKGFEILTIEDFKNDEFYTDDGDFDVWFARKKGDDYEICTNLTFERSPFSIDFDGIYAPVVKEFPYICLLDYPENK